MNTEIEKVVNFACEYFGIEESKVYSHEVTGRYSVYRYMIWYYLHYNKNIVTNEIAKNFNRTKVTVFKGLAQIRDCIRLQRLYREMYQNFVQKYEESRTIN